MVMGFGGTVRNVDVVGLRLSIVWLLIQEHGRSNVANGKISMISKAETAHA